MQLPVAEEVSEKRGPVGLWERVDGLVPPGRSVADLRAHHLQLLAADRWRRMGVPLPGELVLEERSHAIRRLASAATLEKIRDAVEGPIVLFKGAEAAAHYPDPGVRPFGDLDLLVLDPKGAHRALLAAGFESFENDEEYYDGLHHVQPVCWPGFPLPVELHHHPNWIDWAPPPSQAELFEGVVPAAVGIEGISAFDPLKHALVLAVNAWADVPLRRALDLVDIAAVLGPRDPREVQRLADEWDVGRLWRTTMAAMNSMLFDAPRPVSLRTWGRATASVRDATVAGSHFRRLASAFWAVPLHRAPMLFLRLVAEEVLPSDGETWRSKLSRSFVALRNAFRRRSRHEEMLGADAHLAPRRRPAARERG